MVPFDIGITYPLKTAFITYNLYGCEQSQNRGYSSSILIRNIPYLIDIRIFLFCVITLW